MTDRSASVLVTVSVCRSKTLIGAAISPHCTSAACQMEMEGIWYSAEWTSLTPRHTCSRDRQTIRCAHMHTNTPLITSCTIHTYSCTTRLISHSSPHPPNVIIFYREQWCLPPVYLYYIVLYACLVAAFIFVPYWTHPHLVDISFSPISFSLADWTQLSDLPLNTPQTFVLHMSPMWVQQPWDGLNLSPSTDSWRSFLSFFLLVAQKNAQKRTHTQAQTHKHLSASSLSTCDLC